MSATTDEFIGFAEEIAYGTAVAPTRFPEFLSENMAGAYTRVESAGVRAGAKTLQKDHFVPVAKGATGSVKLEVFDKGLGLYLKHMLGSIATTGAADPFTHTATEGDLRGLSLTMQAARLDNSGVLNPFTYAGCKVKTWELSCALDGVLNLNIDFDAMSETVGGGGGGAFALATATMLEGAGLLVWSSGSCTIAGTAFAVNSIDLKGDNGLNVGRWFMGALKKDPLEEGHRKYNFDLKGEFEGLTHYNRVASQTATGALAEVVCTWTAPDASHSLTVTLPNARFDTAPLAMDGAKVIEQSLSGMALGDTGVSPVEMAYVTSDATP